MAKHISELSRGEIAYLVRAVCELAWARMQHLLRQTQHIIDDLRSGIQLKATNQAAHSVDLERMRWAIAAAAVRVPWRADCLLQVMAAEHWLRSAGLVGEFHLGIAKPGADDFKAHAWLTCCGVVVAGGSGNGYHLLIAPNVPPTPHTAA